MSGNITANIKSIVDNLDSIEWQQAIFEAITNALHSGATNISINFKSDTLNYDETKKYIDEIIITDNGEGFNTDNTEAFKEYGTQHKKIKLNIGAKGIGRFLYLKIFDKIYIESLNKEILFSVDENISVTTLSEHKYDNTKVFFKKPRIKLIIDYDNFTDKIKEHFIAYFKLLGSKEINIEIYENDIKQANVISTDIPSFTTKEFQINNHKFYIHYVFNNEKFKYTEGFYCADDRVVIKNSLLDQKRKLKAFQNINILFLLSSEYLNNNVDSTRANFTIMPVRTGQQDMFQDTSWQDIQQELKKIIKNIAKENNIHIDAIAKENLKKSLIKAPHLAYYLRDNENVYSIETLIDNAKRNLDDDKKILLNSQEDLTDEYQLKLSIVTQVELVEYMFYRQKVIERLKKLIDDSALEKEVHNLFMRQKTTDENQDYKTNHLWLFDDRFMTYDKVFSESEIRNIFPELAKNVKRPDILSLVSNTNDKNKITDVVIIELKRPDEIITPEGAEAQLLKYARYIHQSNLPNDIRIWTYAFLKFNEDTDDDLDDKDYNKIPTHWEHPIYYKYHETRNTIINFMDYRALAFDADTRHKTFMNILNGTNFQDSND